MGEQEKMASKQPRVGFNEFWGNSFIWMHPVVLGPKEPKGIVCYRSKVVAAPAAAVAPLVAATMQAAPPPPPPPPPLWQGLHLPALLLDYGEPEARTRKSNGHHRAMLRCPPVAIKSI